jgi:beta-N-acetylhexosaminidase
MAATGAGPSATVLGCLGTVLGPSEAAFFRDADPFGFILFARNVDTPVQLSRLTADLRESVGRDAPILIDQEGGRVQRMRAPHWREWLPPLDQVTATAPGTMERMIWLRYRLIAAELAAVGIDVDCAPSGDLAAAGTHAFLRNRCFGEDVQTVIAAARACAAGLLAGGVLPVIKHMPGHGRAVVDSHHDVPRVTADAEDLHDTDFAVFAGLADLPLGMTGHIVFAAIDPYHPATASPAVIRMIRSDIGFDGLLLTDDISMQALSGTIATRSAAAIRAGCDIVLHCNGNQTEAAAAVSAAGPMTDAAKARATRALALRHRPDVTDMTALSHEFDAIMAGASHV